MVGNRGLSLDLLEFRGRDVERAIGLFDVSRVVSE